MERFKDLTLLFLAIVLAMVMYLVPIDRVLGATTATVTVNATPAFVTLTVAPDTWDVNGITGSGAASTGTTYYSNPLGDVLIPSDPIVDGECRFTITNGSTVATNLTVDFGDFFGGMTMINSDAGTSAATEFGAFSWNSGDTTYAGNRTIAMVTGSDYMHSNLAGSTNIKWGLTILTRTDAWTNATLMQSTVTVTSTVAY